MGSELDVSTHVQQVIGTWINSIRIRVQGCILLPSPFFFELLLNFVLRGFLHISFKLLNLFVVVNRLIHSSCTIGKAALGNSLYVAGIT